MRIRLFRSKRALIALLVAAGALVGVLPPTPAGASPARTDPPPVAPMATAFTTPAGSWAAFPMGRPANPNDVFWELFYRPAGSSGWSLVTPSAVADNGGLSIDDTTSPDQVAGIEPSRYLKFSPLAVTESAGAKWSTGVLPDALLKVPDNLAAARSAATPAGPPAPLLALATTTAGGSLLESNGNLGSWHTVATAGSLARTPAGRSCGRVTVRAVTFDGDFPEVGAACSRSGVVGILTDRRGSWEPTGPHLPGPAGHDPVTVLRLTSVGTATAGLVEVRGGSRASLYPIWQPAPTTPWTAGSPLPLRGDLVATGFASPGPTLTVLVAPGRRRSDLAYRTDPSTGRWDLLPPLPPGTAAVVAPASTGPTGSTGSTGSNPGRTVTADALAVHGKRMTEWQLDPPGRTWSKAGTMTVPLQYGSST